MNKKIIAALLIILSVAVSGCAVEGTPSDNDKAESPEVSGLEADEDMRKFQFRDEGNEVTCYVYDQHDAYAGMGGMSCLKT